MYQRLFLTLYLSLTFLSSQQAQNNNKPIKVYLKDISFFTSYSINQRSSSGLVFLGGDTLSAKIKFSDNFGSCAVQLYSVSGTLQNTRIYKGSKMLFKKEAEGSFNEKKEKNEYRKFIVYTPGLVNSVSN